MSIRYPPEVHAFIRAHVVGTTAADLAAMTNAAFGTQFTPASMKAYKANHHLKSGTPCGFPKGCATDRYPVHVRDHILANYRGVGPTEMTRWLNAAFGTNYTCGQIKAFYANHDLDSGLTGRFQTGHVSHNKGRKGYCAPGAEKTHFRPGHTPHNKTPIGTILVKSDGYLWQKVGEGARDWRQLHRILWEQVNGPVPDDCVLIFKDGDKQNCTLENLALVTKAENAVMNRGDLRFSTPEHTEAGLLIAKIKIAASKRKRRDRE